VDGREEGRKRSSKREWGEVKESRMKERYKFIQNMFSTFSESHFGKTAQSFLSHNMPHR
jgi:hypothetical protein